MSIELCEPEEGVRTATEQALLEPTTVVARLKARRSLDAAGIRELWRYRELVYFFAWRDVKVRYKQAALGAAWAVLQPLLTMVVFTLFFGRLARVPSDGIAYPLFAYAGLVLWTFFSGVIAIGGQSLISNSNLITKVYFPKATLPFASTVSGLLDLAVGLTFLLPMLVYYQVQPSWTMLVAPLFLVALVLLTAGMSLLLAALNVWYRDVKYVLPLLIQLGLFITPVIYPISFVPEQFQPFMAINPLVGIVEGFRACMLLGQLPNLGLTAVSLSVAAIVFLAGVFYFHRAERSFADII
jgi:lipopolysaccharide transport system permease protein